MVTFMWDKLHEKYPDVKLYQIMAHKKIRAAIYLVLWCIFILFIYMVYLKPIENYNKTHPRQEITDTEKEEITEKTTALSFEDKKNKLLTKNFAYVYKYNKDTVYRGKILGDKNVGYKETKDGIEKYYIDNDKAYDVSFGVQREIELDELFTTYFDVAYLFNYIANEPSIVLDKMYNYHIEETTINIFTDENNITRIEVITDEDNYYLEFSQVGEIKEVTIE